MDVSLPVSVTGVPMVVFAYSTNARDYYSRLPSVGGSNPEGMAGILDLSVRTKDAGPPSSQYSTFTVLTNDYRRKWAQKDVPKLEVRDPNQPLDLTVGDRNRTLHVDDVAKSDSDGLFTPPITPNTVCGGPFKKQILQRFCKYSL